MIMIAVFRTRYGTTSPCTRSSSRSPMRVRASPPGGPSTSRTRRSGSRGGEQPPETSRCSPPGGRRPGSGQTPSNIRTSELPGYISHGLQQYNSRLSRSFSSSGMPPLVSKNLLQASTSLPSASFDPSGAFSSFRSRNLSTTSTTSQVCCYVLEHWKNVPCLPIIPRYCRTRMGSTWRIL